MSRLIPASPAENPRTELPREELIDRLDAIAERNGVRPQDLREQTLALMETLRWFHETGIDLRVKRMPYGWQIHME